MTSAPVRVLPVTDLDIARCFAEKFKGKLCHVHAWKSWVSWDGCRWARDPDEKVVRYAMSLADDYEQEARDEQIPDRRTKLFKMAGTLAKGKTIREMISLARALMAKRADSFDLDPTLFNTPLETVQLNSGRNYPNDPIDEITKISNAAFDRSAECPEWHKFLFRIFSGNAALIDFVQKAVGYSLTGYTNERVAFFLYGSGRNGKGTFLKTIRAIMGEYAGVASASMVMSGRDTKSYYDLADLHGLRFVIGSESEKGKELDGAFFKLITGDDPVKARNLYESFFTFQPQFKLWISTNHRPEVDADDQALWDRLRLIPFTVRIPDDEVDRALDSKLQAELPGILAWAVEGAVIWSRDGLGNVEAVEEATLEYRHDADLLGQWIGECCEVSTLTRYRTGSLYESWRSYAKSQSRQSLVGSQSDFIVAMQQKGFQRVMRGGRKSYLEGVALLQPDNEPDDD